MKTSKNLQYYVFLTIKCTYVQYEHGNIKGKIIGKTQMRNNFSSFYEKARNGESLFISDRGDIAVALVPIDILDKESLSM